MITFEEALQKVLFHSIETDTEVVVLQQTLNRILAEPVCSDMNMPPFDKSAMDGYACRKVDLKNKLTVIETIQAGAIPKLKIGENECSKIMTGAMIPQGADYVVKIEDTEIVDGDKVILINDRLEDNICYKGEDVVVGQEVLPKGILIRPQHIAAMASAGCAKPKVAVQPRVAIMATGSELVEPNEIPEISQIRNSNGSQLIAQVINVGAVANYYGIIPDTIDATFNAIEQATNENDVILLTGGVSMGDFDFVPQVLEKAGFKIIFQSIAIQPGKPTLLAVKNNKICFGLPGNPVSSFTQFELLVKPLLYKMMGHNYKPLEIKMPFGSTYSRKRTDRLAWLPVVIFDCKVKLIDYHGSAHINALTTVQGLIAIEIGKNKIDEGELVDVRLI